MTHCGAALRRMGVQAASMEAVAQRTVRYLYDHLVDATGTRAGVLVRFFITYPYDQLDPDLQSRVRVFLGGAPPEGPDVRCQTLLASAGVEADWNDRRRSNFYQVLPLTTEIVESNPMFAAVKDVFGIMLQREVAPGPPFLTEAEQETYNVMYVPDACGSHYLPDQETFVVPYGVRSLLGFYGLLPSANIFTVLVFSRVPIPEETTEYFKTLALNVKLAILPFDGGAVFATEDSLDSAGGAQPADSLPAHQAQAAGLAQLLSVQEVVIDQQSQRIEQVVAELRRQAEQMAQTNAALEKKIAENEQLRRQSAEAAVLKERNRLSRDLHDSVTQALYSQTLYAEAAVRQIERGEAAPAAEHLRQLQQTAQQALREMRLLIFELRPPLLEADGLAAALANRLEAVERRTGLETALHVDETLNLGPELELGLYWIVQEALNNALKYAQAGKVWVAVTQHAGQIILEVCDDGAGFDPAGDDNRGGLGVRGMQERAEKLGGRLAVDSRPGAGTTVRLEAPYD